MNDFARLSILPVTVQAICEALHLPTGTEIIDVEMDEMYGQLKFKVSHPEFAVVTAGELIPRVNILITVHYGERRDRFESKWSGLHLTAP